MPAHHDIPPTFMAQTWVPTWRKRLMLAMLDALALAWPPGGRGAAPLRQAPQDVKRILVVELWNIGDAILAMPFLMQLRALFPAARISMLARPHARPVLEGTGLVDDFIETDLGWTEAGTARYSLAYRWRELRRLRKELRRRDFDLAFKARMHVREHVLLALSGARRRIAFGFGQGDRVLTDPIPVGDPHRHKADDWLKLLKPFGGPVTKATARLHVSEAERKWANEYLRAHGVSAGRPVVGIHPGASIPEKRWPLDRFAAVAHSLAKRADVKVLAFVDPAGYGSSIGEGDDVITTKVALRELIALIERCALLIGNDSGPRHIAGALGVPTVAIFGSGIASWFAPLGEGHVLISGDAGSKEAGSAGQSVVEPFDVSAITVERVIAAADAALAAAVSRG